MSTSPALFPVDMERECVAYRVQQEASLPQDERINNGEDTMPRLAKKDAVIEELTQCYLDCGGTAVRIEYTDAVRRMVENEIFEFPREKPYVIACNIRRKMQQEYDATTR